MFPKINITDEDLIAMVKTKVRNKTPFALTRYGDGECRSLKSFDGVIYNQFDLILNRCGIPHTDKGKADLKSVLVKSMKESDVLGFFSPSTKSKNPTPNLRYDLWSLTIDQLNKLKIDISQKIICDARVHFIFGNIDVMKEILNGNSVHIITDKVDKLKENKINEKLGVNVNYTKIPGMNSTFYSYRKILFNDLFTKIKESVVLYGAGTSGKDIGTVLKTKYGKICIDMGSVLDAWAGVISRGAYKENGRCSNLVIKNTGLKL